MENFEEKSKENLEKEIENCQNEPIEFCGKERSFEEAQAVINYIKAHEDLKESFVNLMNLLQGFADSALIKLLLTAYFLGLDTGEKNREDQESKTE